MKGTNKMNTPCRNPNVPLCYNFPWYKLTDELYSSVIREYLDWGVDTFVMSEDLLGRCSKGAEGLAFVKRLADEFHVKFVSTHGFAGQYNDLNVPELEYRPKILQDHIRGLEITSEFGGKTYTVHVGAWYYCFKRTPLDVLRPLAQDMLEKLLPTAERLGVVIAVENSFEMPNSAKEVLGIVTPFLDNPAIGVCYDTGHANIMDPTPGKDPSKYEDYMHTCWWDGGVIPEAHAIELLQPHIVTTHIHDNSGYGDLHAMPFDGVLDFNELMPKIFACPRMLEYQTEICFDSGHNWAGDLLAPKGGYSIKRQVETFRKLGF